VISAACVIGFSWSDVESGDSVDRWTAGRGWVLVGRWFFVRVHWQTLVVPADVLLRFDSVRRRDELRPGEELKSVVVRALVLLPLILAVHLHLGLHHHITASVGFTGQSSTVLLGYWIYLI